MATLPRYQQRGVIPSDLPQISLEPQRAAMAGASALEQALNRMTSYFEGQAVTEAKDAAMKYAAENPLTEDQVKKKLLTPEKLQVDGAGRIFQQTYEAMQAKIVGSSILIEQQAELGAIAGRIEAGAVTNLSLGQIQKDLKDRRDGVVSLLNQLDPGVALDVSKGIAQSGNALLKLAAKKQAETQIALDKTNLTAVASALIPALQLELDQQVGTNYTPTEAEAAAGRKPGVWTATDFIMDKGRVIQGLAAAKGVPEVYDEFMKNARKSMVEIAARRITTGGLAKNQLEALSALDKGELGNLSDMYKKELTADEQEEVRKKVYQYWSEKHTVSENIRAAEKLKNERLALNVWDEYYKGNISEDSLVSQLKALNQISETQLGTIREGGGIGAVPTSFATYMTQAQNGRLGQNQINQMLEEKKINLKQWVDLNKEINGQNTELGNAKTYINKVMGVPEGLDIAGQFSRQRAAAARVVAQLLKAEADAKAAGLPFNAMETAIKLAGTAATNDTDAAGVNADMSRLKELTTKYGLTGDPLSYTTVDMAMRAGVKSQNDAKEIVNLVKLITGGGQ